MALTPLKLADIASKTTLTLPSGTVGEGRATSYFQRYLQDNNKRVQASINGLAEVIAELEIVVAILEDQQEELEEVVSELADVVLILEAVVDDLADLTVAIGQAVFKLNGQAGVALVLPNGSGDASIFHNIAFNPGTLGACAVFPTGTTFFHVQMLSVDSSNLNVRLFDAAGAPITSGTWPIAYRVTIYPASPV